MGTDPVHVFLRGRFRRSAFPGDTQAGDAVEEPGRPFADAPQPFGGGVWGDHEDEIHPLFPEKGSEALSLVEGQVGDDDPRHSRPGGVGGELLLAVGEDGVHVPHEHPGGGYFVPEVLQHAEDLLQGGPSGEGPLGRLLDHGTVRQGVGEGDAHFQNVRTFRVEELQQVRRGFQIRIAGGNVGDERFFAFEGRAEAFHDRSSFDCRDRMVSMSLSPRPDRFTSTMVSFGRLPAER